VYKGIGKIGRHARKNRRGCWWFRLFILPD